MLGLATSAGFRVVPSRWGVCGVYSATTVLGSRAKSGDAAVTFGDVGVTDPQVLQGLASLRFAGPTNIQAMVLPTLMAAVNQRYFYSFVVCPNSVWSRSCLSCPCGCVCRHFLYLSFSCLFMLHNDFYLMPF